MPPVTSSSSAPCVCPGGIDRISGHCGCGCCTACGGNASQASVRLGNGAAQQSFGLVGGLGASFESISPRADYCSRMLIHGVPGTLDMGLGNNIFNALSPYLCEEEEGVVAAVFGPTIGYWFDPVGEGFEPRYGAKHTLTYDSEESLYVLTSPEGTRHRFYDFGEEGNRCGKLHSILSPGNQLIENTGYTGSGLLQGLKWTNTVSTAPSQTVTSGIDLTYTASGPGGADRLDKAAFYRQEGAGPKQIVRETGFTYYGPFEAAAGNPNDLKSLDLRVPQGSTMVPIDRSLLVYYPTATVGRPGMLKYAFSDEARERLESDPSWPGSVSQANDLLLAKYADAAYEYTDDRVTRSVLQGGRYAYDFAYTESENTESYNHWRLLTTVTRPDEATEYSYFNHVQQLMLHHLRPVGITGTTGWKEYHQYDELSAQEVLHAHPSAIDTYNPGQPDLDVTLLASTGLIELTEYYAATGGGGAKDYPQHEKLKKGSTGTPILQRSFEYAPFTEGETTVYPVSKETSYRNDDGTGEIETLHAYEYHAGTVRVAEQVTTLPAVPADQNGDDVAHTITQLYSVLGHPTWAQDPRGFITYQKHDPVTGALLQMIGDVDMTLMVGVPENPGWTTPAGGGLQQVTDYVVDALGRTPLTLGPVFNTLGQAVRTVAWTIFRDNELEETWSAQGFATYASGGGYQFTLVNPVSISRTSEDGRTSEQIQATRGNAVESPGPLAPSDSFPQASWVRWSRSLMNDGGELVASRVYHTIPASGEGALGTNYDETTYAYDLLGRQVRQRSPGGTITRTVYQAQGRPIEIWVGTNDAGGTDADPGGSIPAGPSPWQNPVNRFDVSGNGFVQLSDLADINSALVNQYPAIGLLPNPPIPPVVPPPYVDVDGDGYLTQNDYDELFAYLTILLGGGPIPPELNPGPTPPLPGTADPANNMVIVSASTYDGGGYGDGNVTHATQFVDAVSANNRVTVYGYDFRNRQTSVDGELQLYLANTYNNLNQVIQVDRRNTTAGGQLQARGQSFFDDRGRVYRTKQFEVDPSTGAVGDALVANTWFDGAGNTVMSQGAASETRAWQEYDGLGRMTRTYVGYVEDAEDPLDDAKVFEQSETTYDGASHVMLTAMLQRYHDDTASVGPLTAGTNARPQYASAWYDGVGRTLTVVNHGTNGGSGPPTLGVIPPQRSDSVLVSDTFYNARGEAEFTKDGNGVLTKMEHDDAGRLIERIESYAASNPANDPDVNIRVQFRYNADSQQSELIAVNASTGDQVTTYNYGVTRPSSAIASFDLLAEVVYPGEGNTSVHYTYNRQGQRTSFVDQNGTVHIYTYDKLGRLVSDEAIVLGTKIDGAVRKLASTYNVRGLVEKLTSYNGSGGVVNEVKNVYNGLNLLTEQLQSHAGAVSGGTPSVEYAYDTTASGGEFTKGMRPTTITYPDGAEVDYAYGTAGDAGDKLARVAAIENATEATNYIYLGAGTFVETEYVSDGDVTARLFYTGGGSGDAKYPGFDRFSRVVDHHWVNGDDTTIDRFQYGYDWNSNRLYRKNVTAAALSKPFDELYRYDRLNRLKLFQRGTLNANKTGLSGTIAKQQDWNLDPTGNWKRFNEQVNGLPSLVQTRQHNEANEITQLSSWFPTAYDEAGNMTRMPKPEDPVEGFAATYDAWNRLVKVQAVECNCPGDLIAAYQYDAQTWRTLALKYVDGELDETRHYFYSSSWQILEERLNALTTPERQHVWGLRYIDDISRRYRDTDASGSLDELTWALQDANWNVTAIANQASGVMERIAYSAYGVAIWFAPDWTERSASDFDWNRLFAGYLMEPVSALYLVRHRWLHSPLGRWTSQDLVLDLTVSDWSNAYSYVSARPYKFVDPFGLAVFAIGGTDENAEQHAATRRFVLLSNEPRSKYWDGTGSAPVTGNTVNSATGISNSDIISEVHEDICNKYCEHRRMTKTAMPINLVGWSRGAVACMSVAELLNDPGCCCCFRDTYELLPTISGPPIGRKVKKCAEWVKPVVNWIGLFDPVSMHLLWGYPRSWWSWTPPPKVKHVSVARRSYIGQRITVGPGPRKDTGFDELVMNSLIFPRVSFAEDPRVHIREILNFDGTLTTHSDVGGAKQKGRNDALSWMIREARAARVDVRQE